MSSIDAIIQDVASVYAVAQSNSLVSCIAFIAIFTLISAFVLGNKTAISWLAAKNSAVSIGFYFLNVVFAAADYFFVEPVQHLYAILDIPAIPPAIWHAVPWWGVLIVAAVAMDFVDYWNHRWMHGHALWPIHAIHHSDSHVNGFTYFRIHLFEGYFMQITHILFLSWLGIPKELVATGALIRVLHNIYVHFEVDIDHGILKYLIASPRFHRWHHADVPEAYGKNLANLVPLFDVLFGTYYVPGTCRAPMGALKIDVPDTDIVKLCLFPLIEFSKRIKDSLQHSMKFVLTLPTFLVFFRRPDASAKIDRP